MTEKPIRAEGYSAEHTELVRSTCLYIATKLGDLMEDIVVIGGLVPTLLVDSKNLPSGTDQHVGTMDLDVGLTLAFFEEERYRTLTERLRRAEFSPDFNEKGNPTRQRWKIQSHQKITVDFLIPPSYRKDCGGKLRNIEPEFAAIIAPGLELAFRDRQQVKLSGGTIFGEQATRHVWVCGPGAYVVLKALAFIGRGENKDAYDLHYLIRNYGDGPKTVARHLVPLATEAEAITAIDILRNDFSDHDGIGPRRVAKFLAGSVDDTIQADVVSDVAELLAHL